MSSPQEMTAYWGAQASRKAGLLEVLEPFADEVAERLGGNRG